MGILYGKKYNPRNRTFSLENGENFIEGTGQCLSVSVQEPRKTSTKKAVFLVIVSKSVLEGVIT